MLIKWNGAWRYLSRDGDKDVILGTGEVAEVSDAKGAQMLADFPECEQVKPELAKKDNAKKVS